MSRATGAARARQADLESAAAPRYALEGRRRLVLRSIRVLLEPTAGSDSENLSVVAGARVSLSSMGRGGTGAALDSPTPATITFSLTRIQRVRDAQSSAPETIATLSGEIVLQGRPPQPVFVVDDPPTQLDSGQPLDAPPDASPVRRHLELSFDSNQFPGLDNGVDLIFPPGFEDDARFLELGAELAIGGTSEAADDLNDRLDVPFSAESPPIVPAFELRLIDDAGQPYDALQLKFVLEENEIPLVTSDDGVARLHGQPAELALARFPPAQQLKAQLKDRWDIILAPTHAPEDVEVILLGPDIEDRVLSLGEPLTLVLAPRVERAHFVNFFYDTNKTFMLPDADGGQALQTLGDLYERNKPGQLLIVGHADAAGGPEYNDKLSLERAETLLDYLNDNVDGWLKWYGTDIDAKKRWGSGEDLQLIGSLSDADTRDPSESPVRWFQRTRGLQVDGKAGKETRRALVQEYMGKDSATLPAEITATTHGCGESFPAVATADGVALQENRRVELYFFDQDLGIQPPPVGEISAPGATDYPEWVRRARLTEEFSTQLRPLVIKLLDAMNEPLPGAPYQLTIAGEVRKGKSNDQGFVHEKDLPVPNQCTLDWGYPPPPDAPEDDEAPPELIFQRVMFLDYAETDDSDVNEAARRRLSNLGYDDPNIDVNVANFQRDFSVPSAAWFDQATFDKLRQVHDDL